MDEHRHGAEAMHSIIEKMLPFKRLQRWSLESKQAWVFGYLTGHNLMHQQRRRENLTPPRHSTYWHAQKHSIDCLAGINSPHLS